MEALLSLALVLHLGTPQADGRTLSGFVEDPSGGAIPSAAITVVCEDGTRTATSDPDGRFRVVDLPAAHCRVTAEATLFDPTTLDVDLTTERSLDIRLTLGIRGFETEVVVTPGRGREEEVFGVPEAVSVTTRGELETRPLQLLPQALREETGVLLQQTTAAQASPFIRGFSAQRIVYLLDGIRFNTSTFRTGATQYLGWIAPGIVERMEVVRGPASVQYGSDALGGSVNVVSTTLPFSPVGTRTSGSVQGQVGSADLSGGLDAAAIVQMPAFAFRVGGAARRVDDLRPGRERDSHAAVTRFLGLPSQAIGRRLPRTGFRQAGGHVVGRARLADASVVDLVYLHEEQFGVSRYDRELGGDGLHRSEFEPQRLDFAVVRYRRPDVPVLGELTTSFSLNRQQDDRLEQARPTSRLERQENHVTAFGYQAQGARRFLERHDLTFGGEMYDEYIGAVGEFEDPLTQTREPVRPRIPDGSRYQSVGLFVQDTVNLNGGLALRGGVRYGHFAFRTRSDPSLGVEEERLATDALTFNVGAVLRVTGALNATASVSRGFRAPNAFDLGAIGISGGGFEVAPGEARDLGAEIGSSDGPDATSTGLPVDQLDAEVLYAYETGLKLQTPTLTASLTGFDLELRDIIQRRTAIFPQPVVGEVIAGFEVVRQDEAGRAFVAEDPRPIATRVNVDRARVRGIEADIRARLTPSWTAGAYFSATHGRDLESGEPLRRMPPPLGGVRLRFEPPASRYWVEGVSSFAWRQTRLSSGDLSDARIGAHRSRESIAGFFGGTATDLGLVQDGVLVSTGETLAEVQTRVLGPVDAAPLFTSTPGFLVFGLRGGYRLTERTDLTLLAENLTDRNYRWHGSGVDAAGINLQIRARHRF